MASLLPYTINREVANRLQDTALPGVEGARAALETFYQAFNQCLLDLCLQICRGERVVNVPEQMMPEKLS